MTGISKLYCGTVEASDPLRYSRMSCELPSHLLQFSKDKKPVVVWNITSNCNLKCVHCYASNTGTGRELNTKQGLELISALKDYGAPVVLFSGGEPLLRKDLPELIKAATSSDLRAVISSNGTLISKETAKILGDMGLSYVGVSLDGLEEINDRFRGVKGAFEKAMAGIENAMAAGIKVGLRFTINKRNYREIPKIFDLMESSGIPRICFYHLVYTGRGKALMKEDLSHEQTRATLDLIMKKTKALIDRGKMVEVLTVDNHSDGPYVYLKMLAENNPRAKDVLELLKMNAGNSSGLGIASINWDGDVFPDQFWRDKVLGNVLKKSFFQIWDDPDNDFLMKLKEKKNHVKGRCRSCRWLDVCAGNFRARAEASTGDPWGEDPSCYLTNEEIS